MQSVKLLPFGRFFQEWPVKWFLIHIYQGETKQTKLCTKPKIEIKKYLVFVPILSYKYKKVKSLKKVDNWFESVPKILKSKF